MSSSKKVFTPNKVNRDIINEYIPFYRAKNDKASKHTIRSITESLNRLSDFAQKHTKRESIKSLSKEDMVQFFNNTHYITSGSREARAMNIIPFFRWVQDLDKHTRPDNMRWFESSSEQRQARNSDPHRKDKLLLTTEDYEKIICYSNDIYGQNKALWEMYEISGFRPEEVLSMTIGDVEEDKDGFIIASCPKSKAFPRRIPLMDYPYNLMRYIGNHPMKNDKTAPLWFSTKGSTKLKPLSMQSVEERFRKMRDDLGLKETLIIKSFRKRRATILFASEEIKINNDTFISKYMGWKPHTVTERRAEYNLYNFDDMKKAIAKPMVSKSYDTINDELNTIENEYKPKIDEQDKIITDLRKRLKDTENILDQNREEFKSFKDEITKSIEELSNPNGKFTQNFINNVIKGIGNETLQQKVESGYNEFMKVVKKMPLNKQIKMSKDFIKEGKIPPELDKIVSD